MISSYRSARTVSCHSSSRPVSAVTRPLHRSVQPLLTRKHVVLHTRCFKEATTPSLPTNEEAVSESEPIVEPAAARLATAADEADVSPVFYELQGLLEVICRDYHPFCCGGACIMPDDAKYQWSFKDAVNEKALTQLISELPVVNTTVDAPLASFEDPEVAEMLTSISDYTQYMLGQGAPIVLNPAEIHVHTKGARQVLPVPRNKRAVDGEHLGTAIMVLPSAHSDTGLSVTWTTGLTHTIDLPRAAAAENQIQWVAYHGRCTYKVDPVEEGQLVVATYDIVSVPEAAGAAGAMCLVEDPALLPEHAAFHRGPRAKGIADEVVRKLVTRVEAAKAAAGGDLGILLSRKYSLEELRPSALKGGDQLVLQTLSPLWHCELRPVLEPHQVDAAHDRAEEVQAAGAVFASGDEQDQVETVGVFVMGEEDELEGCGVEGDRKLVVSSDACYVPGLLCAAEEKLPVGCVDPYLYRPAALIVYDKK